MVTEFILVLIIAVILFLLFFWLLKTKERETSQSKVILPPKLFTDNLNGGIKV